MNHIVTSGCEPNIAQGGTAIAAENDDINRLLLSDLTNARTRFTDLGQGLDLQPR